MIPIPKGPAYIIDVLEQNGFEAYIVGGCVRDALMGKTPQDFDITTAATPNEIKTLFKKTYDTGIKHGTVTVRVKAELYEVTTFRLDGLYKDGRHPEDVSFTKNIEEDLSRRDFTMNAIAYNPKRGFIDVFGGEADIKNKIIRGVGEPSTRFKEDGLRMLRALRFAAQLSFTVEDATFAAIKQNAALIKLISRERIQAELVKLLLGQEPEKIKLVCESGLLGFIIDGGDAYAKTYGEIILADLVRSNKDINERLAILLRHFSENTANEVLTSLRFNNKTIKTVMTLLKHAHDDISANPPLIRRGLAALSPDLFRSLLNFKKSIEPQNLLVIEQAEAELARIIQNNDCLNLKSLAINGKDLQEMGITDGWSIGIILRELLDTVLDDPTKNDFQTLKSTISLD